MPQRLTSAQVPSRSRKPSCWSMTATTVSTAEPRKLATEYQRLEGCIQPNRLAAKAPRIASAPRIEITCTMSDPLAGQGVILLVGDHATGQRHSVGEVIHTCYFYYIPDFFPGQPESLEAFEVFRIAIQRALGDLDGEVQDSSAALVEAGPPVIQGDAVGEDGVAEGLAKGGAVGDQAVQAAVRHRDGYGDHLPLRRVQVRGRLVELAVVGEPSGEPLGTVAVSPEDVGDEPDHLPRLPEKPLQVIGKLGLLGDGEPAYGHTRSLARYVLDIGHRLLLAVYGPHLHFAVTLASGRAARHGLLDAGEVVFGECYTGGASIVFEVLAALGPWDGDDVVPLDEQPSEGQLSRGDPLAFGDLAHLVRQFQVLFEVLLREAWEAGTSGVVLGHILYAPPASGEEAPPERAVGDEPDAQFAHGRQDLVLHLAGKERILRLEGADGVHGMGLPDGFCRRFGEP